ncbi:RNA polymerase sigma-70 factor [Mucilaginibacter ginsenosidivorans]|uniref:RNA polymerase sigma-70 factor n=1 Tax=Mucilaginibacter ginsenosidivorans TaxID=398053 RepID=UPI001E4BF7A9|nr:RNA polymerase sigma-70 factor [Mucilaginibacter ginsenosidivorans]
MALWQQGTEYAFEILYKRHVVKLLSVASKKIDDTETAQEFVQDVFISLFERRDSFDPKTSLPAYLYVALKNRILNHYRHQSVQKRYEQYVVLQQPVVTETAISQLQGKELEMQINEEIKKLPLQCRTVFLLSRSEGLPHKEIAAHLDISVNTVEQHMRKALRILRTSMGNYLHLIALLFYFWDK